MKENEWVKAESLVGWADYMESNFNYFHIKNLVSFFAPFHSLE
jgi:hypothetical protein